MSDTDTGIGIPADMVDAVFERFWQIGTNDQKGLGLGLYISRCIVDAHGGRGRQRSRTPDRVGAMRARACTLRVDDHPRH